MMLTADQLRVAANVIAIADKWKTACPVPRLVHLAVTYVESAWDDQAVNSSDPNSGSFGPYQINGVHPGAETIAVDPWWDYGFAYERVPWSQAWAQYGTDWEQGSLATRVAILQQFGPAAQVSIAWTSQQAQGAYAAALETLEALS